MTAVPVRWLTVVLHREPGLVISASPAGFTFCLVSWHGESTVPGPVRLDGAGARRADAFWTSRRVSSSASARSGAP